MRWHSNLGLHFHSGNMCQFHLQPVRFFKFASSCNFFNLYSSELKIISSWVARSKLSLLKACANLYDNVKYFYTDLCQRQFKTSTETWEEDILVYVCEGFCSHLVTVYRLVYQGLTDTRHEKETYWLKTTPKNWYMYVRGSVVGDGHWSLFTDLCIRGLRLHQRHETYMYVCEGSCGGCGDGHWSLFTVLCIRGLSLHQRHETYMYVCEGSCGGWGHGHWSLFTDLCIRGLRLHQRHEKETYMWGVLWWVGTWYPLLDDYRCRLWFESTSFASGLLGNRTSAAENRFTHSLLGLNSVLWYHIVVGYIWYTCVYIIALCPTDETFKYKSIPMTSYDGWVFEGFFLWGGRGACLYRFVCIMCQWISDRWIMV